MNRQEMISHILKRLDQEFATAQQQWNDPGPGTPTRHCAIDNLLPEEVALEIFEAFPRDGSGFLTRKSFREHKRTSAELDKYAFVLADVTYALQSPAVALRISELTGMEGLDPDPHLYAGGLSMMFKDEFLNPHIDNSHEQTRSKYRRINLLYYVAPDWSLGSGGNLELWDSDVTEPVTIVSAFNRLVLMETNDRSWHSVSPVLAQEAVRCCVSNYYFSRDSPSGADYYHVTSFTGRPGQKTQRALGVLDNAIRTLARYIGMKRQSDKGYSGELAKTEEV
jgi:hypothetical protein